MGGFENLSTDWELYELIGRRGEMSQNGENNTKQHFCKQRQAEIGKKQAKVKQHPEAEFSLCKNNSLSSSTLSSKNNGRYFKNVQK